MLDRSKGDVVMIEDRIYKWFVNNDLQFVHPYEGEDFCRVYNCDKTAYLGALAGRTGNGVWVQQFGQFRRVE